MTLTNKARERKSYSYYSIKVRTYHHNFPTVLTAILPTVTNFESTHEHSSWIYALID